MFVLFILSFFILYHDVSSETNVQGTLLKNTVWTESNSPYYVVGTVGVPKGITLTIEAGVKVVFQQDYGILIKEGVLKSLGTKTQPVSFTSALHSNKSMITFKATNLSESVIQATQFSGPKSSIVLGVIEDDPQDNYGILVLEFCLFINTIINNGNSTRPTWQYSDYTKKILSIVLRDTIILNSTFFCGYGNIQSIYMMNSYIIDSFMELGIYQDSIQLHSTYLNNTKLEFRKWASSKMHIYNSTLHNTHFEVNNGPITLSIYRSTFFNGSMEFYYNNNDIKIMDSMLAYVNIVVSGYYASSGRNYFALFRSTFLHGSLSIRDASAYLIQSNIMLAGTPLLIGDNSRIQCTSITSLAGGSAVTAGIEATDVIIKNSSIYNFYTGIRVSKTSKISFSNIYDNHYNIENRGRNNIEANKNWWGTSNETEISEKIYDFYDDLNFGQVIFSNHFTSTIDLNSSQCSYTKSLTFYNSSIFPTTFTFVRDSPCFAVLFDDESMSNPENGFYSCGFKYSIASSSYNGIILSLSTYNKLLIFLYIFVPFIQLSIL